MWAVVGEVQSVKKILSFPNVNVNLRDKVCCEYYIYCSIDYSKPGFAT